MDPEERQRLERIERLLTGNPYAREEQDRLGLVGEVRELKGWIRTRNRVEGVAATALITGSVTVILSRLLGG